MIQYLSHNHATTTTTMPMSSGHFRIKNPPIAGLSSSLPDGNIALPRRPSGQFAAQTQPLDFNTAEDTIRGSSVHDCQVQLGRFGGRSLECFKIYSNVRHLAESNRSTLRTTEVQYRYPTERYQNKPGTGIEARPTNRLGLKSQGIKDLQTSTRIV